MNDAFHAVRRDDALDEVLVRGVADEQRPPLGQRGRKSRGEVVDHDNAFTSFHQRLNHVTSDIAGAAGYKHGHELTIPWNCRDDATRDAVKSGFQCTRTGHY